MPKRQNTVNDVFVPTDCIIEYFGQGVFFSIVCNITKILYNIFACFYTLSVCLVNKTNQMLLKCNLVDILFFNY